MLDKSTIEIKKNKQIIQPVCDLIQKFHANYRTKILMIKSYVVEQEQVITLASVILVIRTEMSL